MRGNIVYLGRYFLGDGYRSAGAKRVLNQASYLRYTFDLLIITFSSGRSGLNFVRNFYVPEKNKLPYSFAAPLYWMKIFYVLWKRKHRNGKNYLFLETCLDFYSTPPIIVGKLLGYKVIHDVLEDFIMLEENLTLSQKFHVQVKKMIHGTLRNYADGIIVISNKLYKKYEKLNVPIIKLYNSIEPRVVNHEQAERRSFTFFYSGTFSVKDGVSDLIEAFNIVAGKHPHVKLVLVGKGEFSSFEKCMKQIRDNDRISYLGYIPESRMFDELSLSNVCCVTRTNSEYANCGFPFKLAEYLSFGKPILSTAVSDIPDIFTDKHNILLAKPGDPKSISMVMEYAIENQESIHELGKNGKKICNQLFSIEQIGRELSDFVLQLR